MVHQFILEGRAFKKPACSQPARLHPVRSNVFISTLLTAALAAGEGRAHSGFSKDEDVSFRIRFVVACAYP